MTLEIQVRAWDRCTNMAELNQLMGSQSLLITGSPRSIHIQTNDIQSAQITKMNDNKNISFSLYFIDKLLKIDVHCISKVNKNNFCKMFDLLYWNN